MGSKHVKQEQLLGQAESHPIETAQPIAFSSWNNSAFGEVPPQWLFEL